jgi:hypothetical protein
MTPVFKRFVLGAIALTLGACSNAPPHDFGGARGILDDGDYFCSIYPSDGYASLQIGDYWLTVTIPPAPDVWDRGGASLTTGDDLLCQYPVGSSGVRVQWGSEQVRDPDCDQCSTRYHALFVEGMSFAGGEACDCTGDCKTFPPTHADRYYVWCEAPDEFGQ